MQSTDGHNAHAPITTDAVKAHLHVYDHLVKPSTTELMFNPDGSIYTERNGRLSRVNGERLHPDNVRSLISLLAGLNHQVCNAERPWLEVKLPYWYNARLEVLVPPLVDAPSLTFRFPPRSRLTLAELIRRGTITADQADSLHTAIKQSKNIIVAGHTGSGKTTLTNALLDLITEERVLIIEDTPEIDISNRNKVQIKIGDPPTFTTRDAVLRAMRMRPDRIVVGEVRDGGAALELLKALLTHPGTVSTIHADSAEDVRYRLFWLMQEVLNGKPSYELIDRTVHCIVYIAKTDDGERSVRKVTQIKWADPAARTAE